MTQEQKDLLLKDLCARLSYGVKVQHQHQDYLNEVQTIEKISKKYGEIETESVLGFVDDFKPYLFPLSSMTEEQEEELKNIYYSFNGMFQYAERIFDKIPFSKMKYFPYQIEEFFNKNHFDYRGLIPMSLAIDATNLNIY